MFTSRGKYQGHKGAIYELIQLDEHYFISCSGDGYIVKWKIDSLDMDGQLIAKVDGKIFSIALVNQDLLVAGDMQGDVYWIDIKNNKTIKRISLHNNGVFSIMVIGENIYTAGGDGILAKWDIDKFYPLESIQVSHSSLRKIMGLGLDQILVAASDAHIHLVNTKEMIGSVYIKDAHSPSVFCLAGSNKYIYSGGRDAQINQYNLAGEKLNGISAHWFTVNELIHLDTKNCLISASRDKKIRIWNEETLEIIQSIDIQSGGHVNSVNDLLYIAEQNILLSASDDRSIGKFVKT